MRDRLHNYCVFHDQLLEKLKEHCPACYYLLQLKTEEINYTRSLYKRHVFSLKAMEVAT